jgi:hypothetical protein
VGLTFLYPAFLIATVAVAIPVILHLLRRRTNVVVDFPAVRLLTKAPVEHQRRRRLRELVLLALRMTALALLAFAFARPYFQSATSALPAPVTVVAVDTSLSLTAPGQFERARQAARRAVEEAPATHTVALVSFADVATLHVPPTTDRGGTLSAIDELRPTSGGTRFRTALARAAEAVRGGEGAIVVVTDLQQAGWDANDEGAVPDGIDVSVVEIPSPVGNIAVTSARRDGAVIAAAIHNFASAGARVSVQLRIGDREVARQQVDLAPQAASEVRLVAALPARGGAEIRVDDRDGYQGDNARFLVLDPPPATPIAVVTAEPPGSSNAGLYIERALTAADEERTLAVRVVDGREFSAAAGEAAEFGAVILLGTTTLDRAGRERIASFLRRGGRGLLTLGPDIDLATLSETVGVRIAVDEAPAQPGERVVTLIAVDTRHPIFRPFLSPIGALGDVHVDTYRRLHVNGSSGTVLARFSGAGDALIEQQVEQGRLLVFASDLDNRWNRFPLNPAFVPWAVEMARYLVQGREAQQSYTLPNVPANVSAEPGVHRVGERVIAVNTDVRESNPAHMTQEVFAAGIARVTSTALSRAESEAREQEERQRLWQIGLLLLLVALVGEGFVGRKAL